MKRAILLLIGSAVGLTACNGHKSNPEKEKNDKTNAISVIAERVQSSSFSKNVSVSGNIVGNSTVRLGFMVAGKINHIYLKEGQYVKNGQLVATLDPSNYLIAKEMADIQVSQATDEFTRLKILHDRNSLSEGDFKKIEFALQGAKAQQKLQNKNLEDTKLYSPISGILLKKLAEQGEITGSGVPILVLSDISTVKVNAYIPENQLKNMQIGQTAKVQIGALGKKITGKVTEIGATADEVTRAFTIKIVIPNPDRSIKPGMVAEIQLPSPQKQSILSVPVPAVQSTPDGQNYVYVVDPQRMQAFQRNVSIGNAYNDQIEIISGLSSDETIVVGGQQKLTNGSTISITRK